MSSHLFHQECSRAEAAGGRRHQYHSPTSASARTDGPGASCRSCDRARRRSRCDWPEAAACAASLERGINQQQRLLRIPIPQIVRRELKVPAKLARLRVERDNRVGIQVVSLTAAAIGVGIRVSRGPEERPRLRIVAAGQPRRTATLRRDRRLPSTFRTPAPLARERPRNAKPDSLSRRDMPRGIL